MRYVSPKESEKTRANNETKMIEQVQRFLEERSREALQIAKKKILKGKMESEEIKDAFRYYTKDWKDVIHPGLLSIACEAAGGDVDKSVPIQVVMLLLTAGADIHDDIIDESKTKYGNFTNWRTNSPQKR